MANEAEQNDAAIIAEVLQDNPDAYCRIVLAYQQRIYACAYGITRNQADAGDVTQEVFIRFYRHLEQFDSRRPLAPYLYKIAVNCSRNVLRKRQSHAMTPIDEMKSLVDEKPGPADKLAGAEKAQLVRSLIDELPVTLREVCSLFYLSECSCSEVAGVLEMSENAVKVALHRARKKLLQACLAEGGLE